MNSELLRWAIPALITSVAAAAAVGLLGWLARRLVTRRPAIRSLLLRTRWPLRVVAAVAALRVHLEDIPASGTAETTVQQVCSAVLVAGVAWSAIVGVSVFGEALSGRFDVGTRDNERARVRRTQLQVLRRIIAVGIVVVAGIGALQAFPWGRSLGTSVLAAGGIVGVVIGVTGRSTIGNMVAGLQIAFSEPIRFDDVVVVEGEWGRVEEITLTYVVVRLWDHRRLVLPTSYFVEQPFENWTRRGAAVDGAVHLWVDYTTPVGELRTELERILRASPLWDGRTCELEVTDTSGHAMQLRALASAVDAPTLWTLRCQVREGLVRWLTAHRPAALPRLRSIDGTRDTTADQTTSSPPPSLLRSG